MSGRGWDFWTEVKLELLSAYLHGFTTASDHKAHGRTVYLDLFAGTDQNVSKQTGQPIAGSTRRALMTTPPFLVMRGFELDPRRAETHQQAYDRDFPGRDVKVSAGDVHKILPSVLAELSGYRHAPTFAFVDPDGLEAKWPLLERLAHHKAPGSSKTEILLLFPAPAIGRVAHDKYETESAERHAQQTISDVFGCDLWKPILRDRRARKLSAEQSRDELTNLMRWRLENALGYKFTHELSFTNIKNGPLYDMIFATDHPVGNTIMRSVYNTAAQKLPEMRKQILIRKRDKEDEESGAFGLWRFEDVAAENRVEKSRAALYEHKPPTAPYGVPLDD